eukprot:11216482-Lingulodinium_polyedra.AAC.1
MRSNRPFAAAAACKLRARAFHARRNLLARAWSAQACDLRAAQHIQATPTQHPSKTQACLLYTSDAADDM